MHIQFSLKSHVTAHFVSFYNQNKILKIAYCLVCFMISVKTGVKFLKCVEQAIFYMHILCPVKINVLVPWFGLQCVIVARF